MTPTIHLAAFLVTAAIVIAIPGPSVLFTISRALIGGRRAAMYSVVGNATGQFVQIACVAFGIGALVQSSVLAFSAIKFIGALYLVYLGVQAIRNRRSVVLARGEPSSKEGRRLLRDGVVVGLTNPKTIVFFVAVLPQFVDRTTGSVAVQMLLLGLVWALIALVFDTCWAFLAGRARRWFDSSPRRMAAVGGTGGLAMISLGAVVAVTGRAD